MLYVAAVVPQQRSTFRTSTSKKPQPRRIMTVRQVEDDVEEHECANEKQYEDEISCESENDFEASIFGD